MENKIKAIASYDYAPGELSFFEVVHKDRRTYTVNDCGVTYLVDKKLFADFMRAKTVMESLEPLVDFVYKVDMKVSMFLFSTLLAGGILSIFFPTTYIFGILVGLALALIVAKFLLTNIHDSYLRQFNYISDMFKIERLRFRMNEKEEEDE